MLLIDDPAVNLGLACPVKPSPQLSLPLSLCPLEYYFDCVDNLIWRKVLIGFVIMASVLIGVRRRQLRSYEFTPRN